MFCRTKSYSIFGIKAVPVSVEVDASQGLPGFTLVGLPDNAVRESRERVVSAIRSVGKVVTGFRTTVNISPADMRKDAPPLDLAIAVGLLAACVEIDAKDIEKYVFLGELTLDGKVRPVRGVLPVARKICKDEIFVIPSANVSEANIVEGLRYVCVDTLRDCIELLEGKTTAQAVRTGNGIDRNFSSNDFPDFKDIPGLDGAKRALEVAAAGGHNFLLVGSPSSEKISLARCIPGILPEMTEDEIIETSSIHSTVRSDCFSPVYKRPFRSPHHSASMVSLVGGGARQLPGEASLAHNGVLFLDELPEFNRCVLEALREPMEEGRVSVTRASGTVVWPARFMMGAAMNPCPCGYSMDPKRTCTCLPEARKRYRERISGPLLDRIDIQVSVPPQDPKLYIGFKEAESSSIVRQRVICAREIQRKRFANSTIKTNSEIPAESVRMFTRMDEDTEKFAIEASDKLGMVAREYFRMLRVARTVADLRRSDRVEVQDISEAMRYRVFSGNGESDSVSTQK